MTMLPEAGLDSAPSRTTILPERIPSATRLRVTAEGLNGDVAGLDVRDVLVAQ